MNMPTSLWAYMKSLQIKMLLQAFKCFCMYLGWCKVYFGLNVIKLKFFIVIVCLDVLLCLCFEETKPLWSAHDLYFLEVRMAYTLYVWLVICKSVIDISSPVMSWVIIQTSGETVYTGLPFESGEMSGPETDSGIHRSVITTRTDRTVLHAFHLSLPSHVSCL